MAGEGGRRRFATMSQIFGTSPKSPPSFFLAHIVYRCAVFSLGLSRSMTQRVSLRWHNVPLLSAPPSCVVVVQRVGRARGPSPIRRRFILTVRFSFQRQQDSDQQRAQRCQIRTVGTNTVAVRSGEGHREAQSARWTDASHTDHVRVSRTSAQVSVWTQSMDGSVDIVALNSSNRYVFYPHL